MGKHKNLAQAEIHEPLGMATLTAGSADIGKVVASKGDGTSEVRKLDYKTEISNVPTREIIVNVKGDFPTPVSGVITLADRIQYLVCDNFSLGTDRLVMAAFTVLKGIDIDNARLEYTGVLAMITSASVTFLLRDITLSAPTAGASYFDVNAIAGNFIRMKDVCLNDSDDIGTFDSTGSANMLSSNIIIGTMADGFKFTGSWSIFQMTIAAATVSGTGTFMALGTATFTSFALSEATCVLAAAGTTFLSGAAASANIDAGGLGKLTNCVIINVGGGTLLSGITPDDTRWRFTQNTGIRDSRPDALQSFTGNAAATVIAVAGTPVLINATWVDDLKSQFTHTVAGRHTFVGDAAQRLPIDIVAILQMAAGGGDDCKLHVFINGSAVGIGMPVPGVTVANSIGGSNIWQHQFLTNDFVEYFVSNTTGTNNIVVQDAVSRVN